MYYVVILTLICAANFDTIVWIKNDNALVAYIVLIIYSFRKNKQEERKDHKSFKGKVTMPSSTSERGMNDLWRMW